MTTFVIPEFFSRTALLGAQSNFPALTALLAKSTQAQNTYDTIYDLIGDLLRVPAESALGVSPIMQFTEFGKEPAGWSCCASPVVVMPNRDHLDLAQVNGFAITEDEAQDFCDEFNDYFKDDGLCFSFQSPERWYCHAEKGFPVSKASAFCAQGQNIADFIPQGKEGVTWRKIFNDMQLLLHHSATNQKRTLLNKPEINSLWLWGGGEFVSEFDASMIKPLSVVSNDIFTQGLAKRGGVNISNEAMQDESVIIADLEVHDWLDWDEQHFSPALQALKNGTIKKITFHFDLERNFTVSKMDLYRFWRKEKTILDFADTGSEVDQQGGFR